MTTSSAKAKSVALFLRKLLGLDRGVEPVAIVAHALVDEAGHILSPSARRTATASTTLTIADIGSLVQVDAAGATTWTVPANKDVPFPLEAEIAGATLGAGAVTVTAAAGVTLRSVGGALISDGQYSTWAIRKINTDTWLVAGRLTA